MPNTSRNSNIGGQISGRKGPKGDSAYQEAVKLGYIGTEQQWLSSLKGEPGTSIKGDQGGKGDTGNPGHTPVKGVDYVDGENIELQVSSGYIQWRVIGDIEWINLIAILSLKGDKGDPGDHGDKGDPGYNPLKGRDYFDGTNGTNGLNGADGREIELNKSLTHIQWRYIGYNWQDLVLLSSLKGDTGYTPIKNIDYFDGTPGEKGDTGAPSIVPGPSGSKVSSVSFVGDNMVFTNTDTSTATLVNAKIDLKGEPGIQGVMGAQGNPGTPVDYNLVVAYSIALG
jgi:hypothetical protein